MLQHWGYCSVAIESGEGSGGVAVKRGDTTSCLAVQDAQ